MFNNMQAVHLAMLGESFTKQIGLNQLRTVDGAVVPPEWITRSDSIQEYYTNEQIDALLNQYLEHEQSIALTAMQGDGAFTQRGQFTQNVNDRIDQFVAAAINLSGYAFYAPINLNQNHWVLLVMESMESAIRRACRRDLVVS